jgi:hypothetical protein
LVDGLIKSDSAALHGRSFPRLRAEITLETVISLLARKALGCWARNPLILAFSCPLRDAATTTTQVLATHADRSVTKEQIS